MYALCKLHITFKYNFKVHNTCFLSEMCPNSTNEWIQRICIKFMVMAAVKEEGGQIVSGRSSQGASIIFTSFVSKK